MTSFYAGSDKVAELFNYSTANINTVKINDISLQNRVIESAALPASRFDGNLMWIPEPSSSWANSTIQPNGSRFGHTMDAGSGRVVVGAYGYKNGSGVEVGRAHVYKYDGTLIATLENPLPSSSLNFGFNVKVGSGIIVVTDKLQSYPSTVRAKIHIYDLDGNLKTTLTSDSLYSTPKIAIADGILLVGYGENKQVLAYNINGTRLAGGSVTYNYPTNTSGTLFGYSGIAIGSGRVVVGCPGVDTSGTNAGSVCIFDYRGNFIREIFAPDAVAGAEFGLGYFTTESALNTGALRSHSLVVKDGYIIVSCPNQGSINSSYSSYRGGKFYVYDLNGKYLFSYNYGSFSYWSGQFSDFGNGYYISQYRNTSGVTYVQTTRIDGTAAGATSRYLPAYTETNYSFYSNWEQRVMKIADNYAFTSVAAANSQNFTGGVMSWKIPESIDAYYNNVITYY